MKARVKETGKIVNVRYDVHPNPDVKPYWYAVNERGDIVDYYNDSEIELIDTQETPINWEQRRYEIAKAYYIGNMNNNYTSMQDDAKTAVQFADTLIAELKGRR